MDFHFVCRKIDTLFTLVRFFVSFRSNYNFGHCHFCNFTCFWSEKEGQKVAAFDCMLIARYLNSNECMHVI